MSYADDSLEYAANLARTRLNDAIESIGGDVLTDSQPFTIVVINAAWRRLRQAAAARGASILRRENGTLSVPLQPQDPSIQFQLSWGTTPVSLPADLVSPIEIWERPAGQSTFNKMDRLYTGLPKVSKSRWNKVWEWREQSIFMPGTTTAFQLMLDYQCQLADFVAANVTPFASQPIPLAQVASPFAYYIASEMAGPRADLDVSYFDTAAEKAMDEVFGRDIVEDHIANEYPATQARLPEVPQ